jgi:hypothetical protein
LSAVVAVAQSVPGFEELRTKARAGDGQAAYTLGQVYESPNRAVAQPDFAGAAYWYTQACQRGISAASDRLARFYVIGAGVPRDNAKAFQLFESAAKAGYAPAMTGLGETMIAFNYEGNGFYYVRPWLLKAAAMEEPGALNDLGYQMMSVSITAEPPDILAARSLFERAVRGGSCSAMLNLGSLYLNGSYERNFAQAPSQAMDWLAKVQTCPGAPSALRRQASELTSSIQRGELSPQRRQKPFVYQSGQTSSGGGLFFAAIGALLVFAASNGSAGSSSPPSGQNNLGSSGLETCTVYGSYEVQDNIIYTNGSHPTTHLEYSSHRGIGPECYQ